MSLLITHSNFEGMKTVGNVLTNLMESNAKKDVILNAGKKVLFEKTNKDMQELLKKTLLNLPLMERMKDVDGKEYSKARKEFDELTNTIYALNGELNIMVGVQSATEMMEVMELLSFASSATKNEMMGKMNDTMNGYFNKLETQLNNKDNAEKYRNKDFLNRLQALKVFLEDSKLALKDGPSIREKISNIQKKVQ